MLQLRPGRGRDEVLRHQALQLRGDVVGRLLGRAAVFQLAGRGGKVDQHHAGDARHLLRDQVQAGAAFFDAALEGHRVGGQRLGQEGAVECDVDDLRAQVFQRTQRHVEHRHLGQVRDVLFQVLERLLDLQGHQPAQTRAVFDRSDFGLVEDLDLDVRSAVDQRRETHQRLAGLADLHQLGQLAESP